MTVTVQVDWGRDGSWTTLYDDVTDQVRPITSPVSVGFGRAQSTSLTPITAGQGSVVLDNSSRRYSPRNTASPLYGKLKPSRPVRVQRTVSGTTYTLFVGHTDTTPINPDVSAKRVTLNLVDYLADFRGVTISTALYSGIRTGTAIGAVLDAAGWTGARDLDSGGSILPWWWEDGTDALEALQSLVAAEGQPALLTVGPAGEIVFRDRHHRLTRPGSTTSQATFRGSGGVEPVMLSQFAYDEAWLNIINTATLGVPVRQQQPLQVVWSSTDTVDIASGQTVTVKATANDPFTNAVAPVLGDITASAGSVVSATLDRTSGGSVTISLTSTGVTSHVTGLQLRAQPVTVQRTIGVTSSDTSSVADYGARAHPDVPFASQYDVAAITSVTLAQRAQPLPIVTCSFQVGGSGSADLQRATKILALDLSDRVTVIEPETQLSNDFYVESIAHELAGGENHVVTLGLEMCPTQLSNVFVLGTSTLGSGVLAY